MQKRYGILAFPAAHSLSPAMQNAAFQATGIEATYEKFEIPKEELGSFMFRVREEKIAGLSVSIPHKKTVMLFLDEVSEDAEKIGAVNTIYWKGEKLVGENTDWIGSNEALFLSTNPTGKNVVVIGSGGSARAVIYGLKKRGVKEIVVLSRKTAEDLVSDFGVEVDTLENLNKYSPEILINTTPLGMQGENENASPVAAEYFTKHKPLVFDLVYNPRETKLLRQAREAGCKTLSGIEMLLYQGVKQFEIWSGKEAPIEVMEAALEKAL
ncbi:MAG: shikimate dehydrogenase [Candidatus Gracilibacteria bacterium]|nr:shikimate dehydrogenase [Candidatus Gracilibacteria bacterium]MDD5179490.1 shikimate dehydrogenase [Candidatus Gracilibacteria bacterium]